MTAATNLLPHVPDKGDLQALTARLNSLVLQNTILALQSMSSATKFEGDIGEVKRQLQRGKTSYAGTLTQDVYGMLGPKILLPFTGSTVQAMKERLQGSQERLY